MAFPLIVPMLSGNLFWDSKTGENTSWWQARKSERGEQAFSTDPKYRNRIPAVENYIGHIRGMGWPDDLVEVLELEAEFAPADNAEMVYLHMLQEGPVILEDLQYPTSEIRNWAKVQIWLAEAAEASGATIEALEDATTGNIIQGTVIGSSQDAREVAIWTGKTITTAAEGAKSAAGAAARNPWPFVIGIAMTGIILRRARII
jgi:hypothetical protein